MKHRETERVATLTRRIVLTGGAGLAATFLIPRQVLGSAREGQAAVARPHDGADPQLYVFRGAGENRAVIAATWTALLDEAATLSVHAGEQTWTVEVPAGHSNSTFTAESGCQLFAGDILERTVRRGTRFKAVVIEAPTHIISSSSASLVWAERLSHKGSRLRIGSPFLSRLVARNVSAAKLYHASSPAEDGVELTRLVADAIAVNARASGYKGNAPTYGRRVAAALMPDALRFDPHLPVGFGFAARNGRHPDDAAQSVVDTVLSGTLARPVSQPRLPLQGQFPYFPRPTARA